MLLYWRMRSGRLSSGRGFKMKRDFTTTQKQILTLLGMAKGARLTRGQLTSIGLEMIFDGGDTRTELRFVPHVYPFDKVIVDALNSLTISVEVKQFRVSGTGNGSPKREVIFEERIELPFSTWFDEGDYLS